MKQTSNAIEERSKKLQSEFKQEVEKVLNKSLMIHLIDLHLFRNEIISKIYTTSS